MIYECFFDFTIYKPKKSKFIGKSGVIELNADGPLTSEFIEELKTDKSFLSDIAKDLNSNLNQRNIFSITVKSIKPKTDNNDK